MTSAIVNGLQFQGHNDENDNSSHQKEQIYMNGTATDTSDLLKSETVKYGSLESAIPTRMSSSSFHQGAKLQSLALMLL
ncbi:hypothetical protein TNCV_2720121 [Trichonephila clavipes]|nr:hypothetical protein TNCV_2720121 [Trichonephila clavipes]